MRRILALLLLLALPLCGCAASPAADTLASPAPADALPSAQPTPSSSPDKSLGMLYLLAASTWQDVYDENYILTFDVVGGTMTEENTALKGKSTYRISVAGDELCAWTEESGTRKRLPFMLEDGLLKIDYGDPLGVITYAAAEKTP